MNSGDPATTLRAFSDREAIRTLAARYAHCVWTKDAAALAMLFTEDGEMDTGTQLLRGRASIRETYDRVFAEDDFYPFIHNHAMEITGDDARGTCYLDLRAVVGGARMTGFGSYVDRYVRAVDGWKFRSRTLSMQEFVPAPG